MTDRENSVDILMSTYNGARFLDEQIRSVLEQTHRNFRLLVRDDGSSDATRSLLGEAVARWPDRIVLFEDPVGNVGPTGSFSILLEQADADYAMFCDQDDVWLPDKVEKTLRNMKQIERLHGAGRPLLVHTDLTVADESLGTLSDSFWKYRHLDPQRGSALNRLLVQNVVTGCTCMLNRELACKAAPIPPEARMHDWWVALVAAALGRVECLPLSTLIYRQHDANVLGAERWGPRYVMRRAVDCLAGKKLAGSLRNSQRQAEAFLCRFEPELNEPHRAAVRAYARIGKCGALSRRLQLLRHGIRMNDWISNLGLLAGI